eukprot:263868_1
MACFFGSDENKDKIDRLEREIATLKKDLITAKQQHEIEITTLQEDLTTAKQQYEIETSKLKQQLSTNEFDDEKDEEIAINALKRMGKKGKNIKEFMWKTMSELCYDNDEQINDFDEKNNDNNNNIKNKQIKISQLINIKNNQMCKYGHGNF